MYRKSPARATLLFEVIAGVALYLLPANQVQGRLALVTDVRFCSPSSDDVAQVRLLIVKAAWE